MYLIRKNFENSQLNKLDTAKGVLVISIDDLCNYFEIMTLVIMENDQLIQRNKSKWNKESNLKNCNNLIETYLNSPHFVFEVNHKGIYNNIYSTGNCGIKTIINY